MPRPRIPAAAAARARPPLALLPAVLLALLVALAGCTKSVLGIKPLATYVRQGNFMVVEDFRQLRRDMNRNQVLYLIGTPAVDNPFDDDRWDYYYSYEEPGGILRRRHIVVLFRDEKLLTWFELAPGQNFVLREFGKLLKEEDEFDEIESRERPRGQKRDDPTDEEVGEDADEGGQVEGPSDGDSS